MTKNQKIIKGTLKKKFLLVVLILVCKSDNERKKK